MAENRERRFLRAADNRGPAVAAVLEDDEDETGFVGDLKDFMGFLEERLNSEYVNLTEVEQLLEHIYVRFYALSREEQIVKWREEGLADLVAKTIHKDLATAINNLCWKLWSVSMKVSATERIDERCDITDFGIDKGIIEAIAKEFSRPNLQFFVVEVAAVILTSLCLIRRHATRICKSGLVPLLLHVAETHAPQRIGVYSLIALVNLAIHQESHTCLLEFNAVSVSIGLLRFLSSGLYYELDCGLSAAFLICRLVGEDETGVGPDAIHANSLFFEKLYWILEAVVAAGPNGNVIGSHWDPANIILDLSILAVSDRNKRSLVHFIPLICLCFKTFGTSNARLIKFSLRTLSQLSFEPTANEIMESEEFKSDIGSILRTAQVSLSSDLETYQASSILEMKIRAH